jgi:hypothetical protein
LENSSTQFIEITDECMDGSPTTNTSTCSTRTPLVETEVRRSPRIKTRNGGYKSSTCNSKACLACSATPSGLSMKLIKAIGEYVCKVAPGTISESSLLAKNVKVKIVGCTNVIKKTSVSKKSSVGGKEKKKFDSDEYSKKKKN